MPRGIKHLLQHLTTKKARGSPICTYIYVKCASRIKMPGGSKHIPLHLQQKAQGNQTLWEPKYMHLHPHQTSGESSQTTRSRRDRRTKIEWAKGEDEDKQLHTNRKHNHRCGNAQDGEEGELGLAMEEEEIARTHLLSMPPNEMGKD